MGFEMSLFLSLPQILLSDSRGAKTLSIKSLSITTLSIKTLSILTQQAERCYVKCRGAVYIQSGNQ
jgi:hypothetical protein